MQKDIKHTMKQFGEENKVFVDKTILQSHFNDL